MNLNTKNKTIRDFTDLIVWQNGHRLVLQIYRITELFPKKETYSLTDQMRRAASSITNNIAEGFGRQTYKEKVHFYYQAQGSLIELKNQILISGDINYISDKETKDLLNQANITHQLLQGLITKSKTFIKH